jgi:FlaA1/EpsC-like NDP-sugar epimerase
VIFWLLVEPILRLTVFPSSIYVLEAFLTASLLIGARLACRVFAESVRENLSSGKKVLLIGAGSAAQTILREIGRRDSGYVAVGCLDDNQSKRGVRIHDVPVLGSVDRLPQALASQKAEEVLIAVPSASNEQMRRFIGICNQCKVKFRTVPVLKDLIAGRITISQLREVSLEDLLGRDPVRVNLQSVRREIEERVVLVTGAAGSIGSELCRQILAYGPARLICLDQNETGLFYLEHDLRRQNTQVNLAFCVCDLNDAHTMPEFLSECSPDIIFHAAAYKHVPMMESNIRGAIRNNVLNLSSLLDQAEEAGCWNFVLISSDKAVNPTNVMGATKRICELIVASRPRNGMRCVSVRFGNVLGSNGSVVPLLQRQLEQGQPLTITHPEIKRFFMTTSEAVALVLQGFALGSNGDILVLDMGEPIRIVDLARTLISLSGRAEEEVEIRFTGLRQGEKMEEELFYRSEDVLPTTCEKIKRTNGATRNWTELQIQLDSLRRATIENDDASIRSMIREIVPEYAPQMGCAVDVPVESIPRSRGKGAGF